ncbi:hypothetical protein [Burkholderia ambifaria]|uniref:hypothetical protein n=1 Tax=Burkholderia ambifaria TaxID=152480 RepID=UPI0013E0C8D0|nr:hypothetical protein [Burkholderia ambifaria]
MLAKYTIGDILTAPAALRRFTTVSDAMTHPSVSSPRRVARAAALLDLAQRSALHRHLAYVLAGFYNWFNLLPAPPARPTRLRDVACAGFMLVILLVFVLGPVLRLARPVFVELGRWSAGELALGFVLVLVASRWLVGWMVFRRLPGLINCESTTEEQFS